MYQPMPLRSALVGLLLFQLASCSSFQSALAPALPTSGRMPAAGQIPDSVLREAVRHAELVVLGTPVELASLYGFMTARFQFGAKETWYDVRVVVDSVLKGKLKRAKWPDLGMLPATFKPPPSFGKLAPNEIVVQYPAVNTTQSDWASAPPLVPGERAVFIFRRCYYCVEITGLVHPRGTYYKANPLVAIGWESKLPEDEWDRVQRLVAASGKRH
jgi:hypothetical protein